MGDVVRLKSAVATTATFQSVVGFPAVGDLSVIVGKAEWPDRATEWVIAVRAPGAPDMMLANGPWPEGWPDEKWSEPLGVHIELARATLAIARKRVSALTAERDTTPPKGAA